MNCHDIKAAKNERTVTECACRPRTRDFCLLIIVNNTRFGLMQGAELLSAEKISRLGKTIFSRCE